jgi:hypothetical protein
MMLLANKIMDINIDVRQISPGVGPHHPRGQSHSLREVRARVIRSPPGALHRHPGGHHAGTAALQRVEDAPRTHPHQRLVGR